MGGLTYYTALVLLKEYHILLRSETCRSGYLSNIKLDVVINVLILDR